jgi:hypothetical protein
LMWVTISICLNAQSRNMFCISAKSDRYWIPLVWANSVVSISNLNFVDGHGCNSQIFIASNP